MGDTQHVIACTGIKLHEVPHILDIVLLTPYLIFAYPDPVLYAVAKMPVDGDIRGVRRCGDSIR